MTDRLVYSPLEREKAIKGTAFVRTSKEAGHDRIADQFSRQAVDATRLADLFENADLIDVWHYDGDSIDGDDDDAIAEYQAAGERRAAAT